MNTQTLTTQTLSAWPDLDLQAIPLPHLLTLITAIPSPTSATNLPTAPTPPATTPTAPTEAARVLWRQGYPACSGVRGLMSRSL